MNAVNGKARRRRRPDMMSGCHRAFFLVGPTAAGKSAVAHALARAGGMGILSADSMVVYRGLDLGTAKPTPAERGELPYWGVDCVNPDEEFSAGKYMQVARGALADAERQKRSVLVAGGTGLYVQCLLHGLRAEVAVDAVRRAHLDALLAERGVPGLQEELARMDPARLRALKDPLNPRRLLRALELAGQPTVQPAWNRASAPPLVGLRRTQADLEDRMRRRVDAMFTAGLIAEARALRERYSAFSATASQAIGYAEAWAVLDGRQTESQARDSTFQRTRRLAKRQMTWFRHQATMLWIDVTPDMTTSDIAAAVRAHWTDHGPTPLVL